MLVISVPSAVDLNCRTVTVSTMRNSTSEMAEE